jgi:hypothetical protein
MTPEQLFGYLDLIDRIDAIQPAAARAGAVRTFQASFELLRYLAKNSSLSLQQISGTVNRALRIDPSPEDYSLQLLRLMLSETLGDSQTAGSEVEEKLIAMLIEAEPVELPFLGGQTPALNQSSTALLIDSSQSAGARVARFLTEQRNTRLAAVVDAAWALDELEKNPSAVAALTKLTSAGRNFVEDQPQIDPKKKKPKAPVAPEVTLKDTVAQLALPIERSKITSVRARLATHASEALLTLVYAVYAFPKADGVSFKPDLIRTHDFTLPWNATRVGPDGRITGNLTRLNQALLRLTKTGPDTDKQPSAFVETTLNSFQLMGRRWVTSAAVEFVARTVDLGEEVLALYKQGDEDAARALNHLNLLMSQRRSVIIKTLVDGAEIIEATQSITPSEAYALGRVYLDHRIKFGSLDNLKSEPGSLGALARLISKNQNGKDKSISLDFLRQVNQFGVGSSSLTGLNRLVLLPPEPYEYAASFREEQRLAERIQDLKLVLARRAYRAGGNAKFPFNLVVAESVMSAVLAHAKKATRGTPPPQRDWQSLIAAIQSLSEIEFATLVKQISNSAHVRSVGRQSWDNPALR